MYFNEHDPNAAEWIRELFPSASVDTRDIQEVRSEDFAGHGRVHFFAGIAGWEYALRLTGIPDDFPVWTGSCPCQPFSVAGKGKGFDDERHLWPEFFRLIQESRPVLVFGEQVAKRAGISWLAGVQADLERAGYTVGAACLPAAGVGAPHVRERLYWGAVRMGDSQREGYERLRGLFRERPVDSGGGVQVTPAGGAGVSCSERLPDPNRGGRGGEGVLLRPWEPRQENTDVTGGSGGDLVRLPDPERDGLRVSRREATVEPDEHRHGSVRGFWSRYDVAHFADGKSRRIEPGTFPLAHGLPRGVGYNGDPRSPAYVNNTSEARVTRLKGYGNAIVPQVAAIFIRCFLGAICDLDGGGDG